MPGIIVAADDHPGHARLRRALVLAGPAACALAVAAPAGATSPGAVVRPNPGNMIERHVHPNPGNVIERRRAT